MKKTLIPVLLVATLSILGIGGWLFLDKEADARDTEPRDVIYVDMDPVAFPVLTGDRVEQLVMLGISLQVGSEDNADLIRRKERAIADAMLRNLYGRVNTGAPGRVLDIDKVREKLAASTASVVGEDIVDSVLIRTVSQRRM